MLPHDLSKGLLTSGQERAHTGFHLKLKRDVAEDAQSEHRLLSGFIPCCDEGHSSSTTITLPACSKNVEQAIFKAFLAQTTHNLFPE